jgi:hypothetical protein
MTFKAPTKILIAYIYTEIKSYSSGLAETFYLLFPLPDPVQKNSVK